jgi:DUF971 family protein
MTDDNLTPTNVDLKKDERLLLTWPDGTTSAYSISLLRTMCPCAMCRTIREGGGDPAPKQETGGKKTLSLNLLPGNFSSPLSATNAELVGNYALKLDWSDGHGSGIYSWRYLRDISPS